MSVKFKSKADQSADAPQNRTLTVATSILAELSFGISHMKLSKPSSVQRGMSCQAETFLPPEHANISKSYRHVANSRQLVLPLSCKKMRKSVELLSPWCTK